jgi:hypothetical protein
MNPITVPSATFRLGAAYTSTKVVGTIPALCDTTVAFDTWTVALPRGWNVASCSVEVESAPSQVAAKSVFIGVLDAKALGVAWPTGESVSDGINHPRARVQNCGTDTVVMPISIEIFDSLSKQCYADPRAVQLAPAEIGTVVFAVWNAGIGSYSAREQTELPGDCDSLNDTTSDVFSVIPETVTVSIISVYPRDSVLAGTVSPYAVVANQGASGIDLASSFDFFRLESLPADADTLSTYLAGGVTETLKFAPCPIAGGQYRARLAALSNRHSFFDTLSWYLSALSVAENKPGAAFVPTQGWLVVAAPNPLRGAATIRYLLPRSGHVRLVSSMHWVGG